MKIKINLWVSLALLMPLLGQTEEKRPFKDERMGEFCLHSFKNGYEDILCDKADSITENAYQKENARIDAIELATKNAISKTPKFDARTSH